MTDSPSPGTGYVLVLLLVLAAGIGTSVGVMLEWSSESTVIKAVIVALLVVPLVLIALLPLQAAARTRYTLADGVLSVRAGVVIKAQLKCADIEQVVRVPFIPRVLGWGGGRGLANRFTDGVQVVMRSGAVYYLSPSDPDCFVEAVERARE